MKLLAVAYPFISEEDHALIEKFRAQYDPQFSIIKPHFTLVFPLEGLDEIEFADYAASILHGKPGFHVRLRAAIIHKDELSENFHVFLVPDEGSEQITDLHSSLYKDVLKEYLMKDIPYAPHITIGTTLNENECIEMVGVWNRMNIEIRGEINAVEVLSFDQGKVRTIERVELL